MSRHIIDKTPRSNTGGRLKSFVEIARENLHHPATETLIRRPEERLSPGARLREFVRIERGRLA